MPVTLSEVAKAAGVGEATVVRALKGNGYVSPATRARIVKVAAELKYRPSHIARSLALGKSDLVGIISNAGMVPGFYPYLEIMEQAAKNAGFSTLFSISTGTQPDSDRDNLEDLISKRVPGALVIPGSLYPDPQPYKDAMKTGIKLVVLDKKVEKIHAPQLMADHYKAGRIATEHLIKKGHRRIAYLAIPEASFIGKERARGFRDALEAGGIPLSEVQIIETAMTEEGGEAAAGRLLSQNRMPTAIFARHDSTAIGVMKVLCEAGISIPRDVSLISYGDIGTSHMLRVPLTTVHSPEKEMAEQGVKTLLGMLSGEKIKLETRMLDVHLVERESTGPPPV